jgi:hypothetical protein
MWPQNAAALLLPREVGFFGHDTEDWKPFLVALEADEIDDEPED